jgi:predicted ATPase
MATITSEINKAQEVKEANSDLLLDSLEIQGYRCFENLTIEKLGRVNLIVGKNNVGKTALLESLWVYSNQNNPRVLDDILNSRKEHIPYHLYGGDEGPIYRHLFFDRETSGKSLQIGSNRDEYNKVLVDLFRGQINISSRKPPAPRIIFDDKPEKDSVKLKPFEITNFFVGVTGLKELDIDILWEKIELTPLEDKILDSLRLILPKIVKVRPRLVNRSGIDFTKIVYAQSSDRDEPLPLKSFGEGLNRLFEIVLVLVSCKDGILLIDEIENGLHYSVLPDVWKLIFHTAKELNVQVFASTHSYDCIETFSQAAIDEKESDGMLIRLARSEKQIKAFTFDEKELETISKEKIEVR